MNSLGIVIYKNGDKIPFGRPVYMDQKGYIDAPGHEKSFNKEIASSMTFKFEEYNYDKEESFYRSIRELSQQGLVIILNNKCKSKDQNQTLGYMPSTLTEEQKTTIKEMIDNKEFEGYIEELYEFIDEDEPIKYNSLEDYYTSKIVRAR